MSFDEQLRRLFDTALTELTDVARADVDRAREEGVDQGRKQGIDEGRQQGIDEGRHQGVAEGRQQGLDEGRRLGIEEGRAQGWEDGREQGRFEGQEEAKAQAAALPGHGATLDRVVDGLRAIDRARSLSETLDTLAACAGEETTRAAVLLVREDRLRAWRFIGFDAAFDASSFETTFSDAPVVAEAISTRAVASASHVPAFAQPGDGGCFAMPLEVGGSAVAVLYADGFDDSARAGGAAQRLEALGRHASRTLEALTALKAARAVVEPASVGQALAGPSDADDADGSARRYARLLVSEIKLYHEPAVAAGRRDRDLAERLGGEIARARVLYEQRVPQSVRTRTDYFRDELVRTLANGDATLLQLT
jgi:hypothetical protein